MKALSLTQPWATLIAIGAKRIETRSWSTRYRGPLAIHASKGFPRDCQELCATEPFLGVLKAAGFTNTNELPEGAIVAVARVMGCTTTGNVAFDLSQPAQAAELQFGDYSPDRWAFFIQEVKPLRTPIPCAGALGFWDIPPAVLRLVLAQVTGYGVAWPPSSGRADAGTP